MRDRAFNIAKNLKYDKYQKGIASKVYKFFNKKSILLADKSSSGGAVKDENISNQHPLDLARGAKVFDRRQKSASELHQPIIRKFEKRKVYSPFIANIWGSDLGVLICN